MPRQLKKKLVLTAPLAFDAEPNKGRLGLADAAVLQPCAVAPDERSGAPYFGPVAGSREAFPVDDPLGVPALPRGRFVEGANWRRSDGEVERVPPLRAQLKARGAIGEQGHLPLKLLGGGTKTFPSRPRDGETEKSEEAEGRGRAQSSDALHDGPSLSKPESVAERRRGAGDGSQALAALLDGTAGLKGDHLVAVLVAGAHRGPGGPYAGVTATLTFLFTDIEGSTGLLERLGEDEYAGVLAEHHRLIREALAANGGEEVATQGDGFFAVFTSPRACITAVIEMQRTLEASAWPAGVDLRVRMGVHCGEASVTITGLVGLDVHRAARIAAVAHGGQVVVSSTAAALVGGFLPVGASLRDLGLHRLKDLGRPEQIFQLEADGLREDFGPLRSLDNPGLLNNLPAQLATFVGRERELEELRGLVATTRLVTLTGAGGAGKTRLALHVAAGLVDGFGDGVWLVDLAPVGDEEAVALTFFDALRLANGRDRPPLDVLLESLISQQALIVLDNCEHVVGACAKVADAILRRCPHVHLLATSREPLGVAGETIYRVPSLSLPDPVADGELALETAEASDAVALFTERARGRGSDSSSTPTAPPWSSVSAGASTACRSPSSWRPRGSVLFRWQVFTTGSTSGFAS